MSKALSYATPKSYDALPCTLSGLGTCLAPPSVAKLTALEQAFADQATLIARDVAAHSDRDFINKGLKVKHNTNNSLTRFAHASNMRTCT